MARNLNPDILEKIAERTGKRKQYLREQISRRASRLGVSSIAAQLVMAKEAGMGIARALNKLPADIREEVRSIDKQPRVARSTATVKEMAPRRAKEDPITAATIDSLLEDQQLRKRCKDLLRANRHFDRVFREATTVLDHRLKQKSGLRRMSPQNLVGKALHPDPQKAVIEVSEEPSEQEGFHSICKGIMLAFRNTAHHTLSDKFTREDALKFCAFIDSILDVIEQAKVHSDRV